MKRNSLILIIILLLCLITGCKKPSDSPSSNPPSTDNTNWINLNTDNYKSFLKVTEISLKTGHGVDGTALQFESVASYLYFDNVEITYTYMDYTSGNGSSSSPYSGEKTFTATITLNVAGGGTTKATIYSKYISVKVINVTGRVKEVS